MLIKTRIYRSSGFKIITFYILLSLITLSFIISIIFENQVDIIGKNTMLESEKQVSQLIGAMKKFNMEMKKGSLFRAGMESGGGKELTRIINMHFSEFIIFSEKGAVIYKSSPGVELPATSVEDGLRAMTAAAFSGRDYYLRLDEEKKLMNFYIPLGDFYPGNSILLIKKDISLISSSLSDLYRQSIYVILVVLFFHVIFALYLYWSFIIPVKKLSEAAVKLSAGDLSARVEPTGKNHELDSLAAAFNNMAESIHNNISSLSTEMETVKTANREMDKNSTRDDLTGLLNGNYLGERIDEEITEVKLRQGSFSLTLIDIDDFGRINDLYGNQTGKILLMETAKCIAGSCRNGDIPARTGENEFTILSPDTGEKGARELAERIRLTVAGNRVVTPDGELSVTVSIGVSSADPGNLNRISKMEDIKGPALSALSRAKARGKNRVETAS